jgi:DNA-binding GntR family transcriptional regulator
MHSEYPPTGLGNWEIQLPKSISNQVYDLLKGKILASEIEPGERLMQIPVAEALNVSRTPIREAFVRLEHDGLVERLPQGGVRVTPLSLETINKVFGIRGVLEGYAAELVCDNITPAGLEELELLRDQAMALLSDTKVDEESKLRQFFQLNTVFHDVIYAATGNEYLERTITNLKNLVLRMRALGLRRTDTWIQAWEEHARLIELIKAKDKVGISRLMRVHVTNAAGHVISSFLGSGPR